jgi:hypothetical protein
LFRDAAAKSLGQSEEKLRENVFKEGLAEGKVRKEFWLDPEPLAEAQAFLGIATERATIEVALELVAFRRDLAAGARALKGLALTRID